MIIYIPMVMDYGGEHRPKSEGFLSEGEAYVNLGDEPGYVHEIRVKQKEEK